MTGAGRPRLLIALATAAACRGHQPPATPPAPMLAAAADAAVVVDGGRPDEPAAAPRLAPHTATISAVVLDRAATAAVSLDDRGGARLWPTLDGTREPAALPFHGAAALDLAQRDDGFVVGMIDPSGAPHLYRLDERGGLRGSSDLPAVPPGIGLVALSADAWLLVRADQSIDLYDRDGHRHGGAARDRTRIEAIRAAGPAAAVAMISERTGDQVRYALVSITAADDQLRWGEPVPLAIAPTTPVELALAPDGKHVAYLSTASRAVPGTAPVAPTAGPATAGTAPAGPATAPAALKPPPPQRRRPVPAGRDPRRERVRGPKPPGLAAPLDLPVVVVVERATGAVVRQLTAGFDASQRPVLVGVRRLGFVDDATVVACDAAGACWPIALDADAAPRRWSGNLSTAPAIGPGVLVGGSALVLMVSTLTGPPGYLGYRATQVDAAALSPDGSRVAWLHSGQLAVEPVVGDGPAVQAATTGRGFVAFVDATTLVVTGPGEIALLDAASLATIATQPLERWRPTTVWNPRTGWLAGRRQPDGAWAARVTATAISRPRALDDGSTALWSLDGATADAPALVTRGDDHRARTYAGHQLAAGGADADAPAPVEVATTLIAVEPSGAALYYDGRLLRGAALATTTLVELGVVVRPREISTVPGGGLVMLTDGDLAIALDRGARPGWTVPIGARPQTLTLSADGRRALALTLGGATVIDVETGAVVERRCGWDFGLWPERPTAVPATAQLMCE